MPEVFLGVIKGPKGDKGDPGKDGTMTFEDLTEEQKASLKGDKGDTGPQGPQGDKGDKGDTGAKGDPYTLTEADKQAIVAEVLNSANIAYVASAAPTNDVGNDGDLWIVTE